jgi:Uma2 family endonuclease
MAATLPKQKITPEQLLAMPDSVSFELVDGELQERNVSVLSSWVEGEVYGVLRAYCRSTDEGIIWPGTLGCRCYPNSPDKIRKPDVVVVLRERFAAEHFRDGFLTIRPDMVVEVISPNDSAYEVDEKIEEYLSIAVPLVWIVNPDTRVVEIKRPDGTATRLHAQHEITGESVLPGFRCRVGEFFPSAASQSSI